MAKKPTKGQIRAWDNQRLVDELDAFGDGERFHENGCHIERGARKRSTISFSSMPPIQR